MVYHLAVFLLLACNTAPVSTSSPPPVVLVSLDTFRADRLGVLGNPDGLTPSLDRFASESVVFERAYAQSTTTSSSHASFFTSRYPTEQNNGSAVPEIAPEMATLAEVVTSYGWSTAAFVAGGHLAPEIGVGRGFALWNAVKDFGSLWHTVPPALAWLDEHPVEPYLLFVHGYDAHMPYLKPDPFGFGSVGVHYMGAGQAAARRSTDLIRDDWFFHDETTASTFDADPRPRSPETRARLAAIAQRGAADPFTEEDARYVAGVYDGGVAWADMMFGVFMAELAERGVLDEAIVVVFSDHGEQLWEDGLFQHSVGASDPEAHVVLMVRMPGGIRVGRVSDKVELIDVMPTLLELAGMVAPAGIHGRSFASALRGEPFTGRAVAWTQGGIGTRVLAARTDAGRLVYDGVPLRLPYAPAIIGAAGLPGPSFHVADGALDAAEQERLRGEMVAFLGGLSRAEGDGRALSPGLASELRAHGYWDAK